MPGLSEITFPLMTVLMHDARRDLLNGGAALPEDLPVSELLHADHTRIIDADSTREEQYITCIGPTGETYGLVFN